LKRKTKDKSFLFLEYSNKCFSIDVSTNQKLRHQSMSLGEILSFYWR
jgi:hypothetical protein